jgi:hypothetical protein
VESEEAAIGLEMLRLLSEINEKNKKKNFFLKVRFSIAESTRFDEDAVYEEWD